MRKQRKSLGNCNSRYAGALVGVALVGVLLSGCPHNAGSGSDDMTPACDGFHCQTGGCDTQSDCSDGLLCDTSTHLCVGCVGNQDCPDGKLCSPSTHACADGCSSTRPCPSGLLCNLDQGLCVQCLAESDCTDPANPRCDLATNRCVPCLPDHDDCGHATYCAEVQSGYACSDGCKDDSDCAPLGSSSDAGAPDAGALGDGGITIVDGGLMDWDAGMSLDANMSLDAAIDAGADLGLGDGGTATRPLRCDKQKHQCVSCVEDADCPLGRVCSNGSCVEGCSGDQACPPSKACCDSQCVDTTGDILNCGGCGMACAGGDYCCDSLCVSPATDVNNCGGCGIVCVTNNASSKCERGACQIERCTDGWADCNGVATDGCETHTAVNVGNCGGCNMACSVPHANPKCVDSACQVDACIPPYGDCDGDASNGCETIIGGSDLTNCGGCGTTCSLANAEPKCVSGACAVKSCAAGWGDCDHDPANGCEVDTTSTVAHCGGCGQACAPAHATPKCTSGACQIAQCDAGWTDCDGSPANGCETHTDADAANCGTCNNKCSADNGTPSCSGGMCGIACSSGFADCDHNAANGCEINTNTDVTHCGGCSTVCNLANATPKCSAGACAIASCNGAYRDCNASASDGCEIDSNSDVNNCGACNTKCSLPHATPKCSAGACQVAQCDTGWSDCDGNAANGCETNTGTDVNHCGGCGTVCSPANATAKCSNGTCGIASCNAGFSDCDGNVADGCEVNTQNDANNCSACGAKCDLANATAQCTGGNCAVKTCASGFQDCDALPGNGCEVNTNTSVNNCGMCRNACNLPNATPACSSGACTISACLNGFADCNHSPIDGCEVSTKTDPANCGACDHACSVANGTPACTNSACGIATCNTGFSDCNNNYGDGCETNTTNSVNNCGLCGRVCVLPHAIAKCASSACAIAACDNGWADCNDNPADGCETNILGTDVNNCGACGFACNGHCSPNSTSQTCQLGVCKVASCTPGYYDYKNDCGDGCECKAGSDGGSCTAPTDLGAIALGGTVTRTTNIAGPGQEAWYKVSFASNADPAFHPHIRLATNPNSEFRFDVRSDCTTALSCGTEGGVSAARIEWEVTNGAGGYDPASSDPQPVPNPGTLYVRVYRASGALNCDSFTLTFTN